MLRLRLPTTTGSGEYFSTLRAGVGINGSRGRSEFPLTLVLPSRKTPRLNLKAPGAYELTANKRFQPGRWVTDLRALAAIARLDRAGEFIQKILGMPRIFDVGLVQNVQKLGKE